MSPIALRHNTALCTVIVSSYSTNNSNNIFFVFVFVVNINILKIVIHYIVVLFCYRKS